jgi:hypothetical protein
MVNLNRWAGMALLGASFAPGSVWAQPALTTIQDILYRADGTRFSGTMFITYSSFQAGDTSNIATANLTLPIVNGALSVQLAPTTTASAGAQYNVLYNSDGVNQFTQVWAVPPSAVTLRIRDVLVSTGTVVGPLPVTAPIQISDVVGLQNALALTVMKGVGFALGRTAVINTAGQVDAAAGNLSDCMRVDGSSGPCGSSGGGVLPSFSDGEVPAGTVNGANTAFTLAFAPSPVASLELYVNGLRMEAGTDYQVLGKALTFLTVSTPQTGDLLLASYRYANPSNPLSTLASPQVVCSSVGSSTSGTTQISLGTCTLPAGLLSTGDRIEVRYQYGHVGSAAGFTGEVHIGGTTVVSRSAAATETEFVGHTDFGTYSGAQLWDTQSWGSTVVAFAAAAGAAAIDITQALTVDFRGEMAAAGSDSVVMRNFTVVRYPAQTNP